MHFGLVWLLLSSSLFSVFFCLLFCLQLLVVRFNIKYIFWVCLFLWYCHWFVQSDICHFSASSPDDIMYMRCMQLTQFQMDTSTCIMIRPNKKISMVPVTRPTFSCRHWFSKDKKLFDSAFDCKCLKTYIILCNYLMYWINQSINQQINENSKYQPTDPKYFSHYQNHNIFYLT